MFKEIVKNKQTVNSVELSISPNEQDIGHKCNKLTIMFESKKKIGSIIWPVLLTTNGPIKWNPWFITLVSALILQ